MTQTFLGEKRKKKTKGVWGYSIEKNNSVERPQESDKEKEKFTDESKPFVLSHPRTKDER